MRSRNQTIGETWQTADYIDIDGGASWLRRGNGVSGSPGPAISPGLVARSVERLGVPAFDVSHQPLAQCVEPVLEVVSEG